MIAAGPYAYAPMLPMMRARNPRMWPSAVDGERDFGELVATVPASLEVLVACRTPAHRAAELARGVGADDILGVEHRLHAEPAADVADAHAHRIRRQLEHVGELLLLSRRRLRTRMQGQASARGVELGSPGARLEGHGREALVVDGDGDDMRGRGESRIARRCIAVLRDRRHVAGRLGPQRRRDRPRAPERA